MTSPTLLESFRIATVVWRESFEALLVIAILQAWTVHESVETRRRAARSIAGGAAVGMLTAVGLAFLMGEASDFLDGDREEVLQLILAATASALMLRMVIWMRSSARHASSDMKSRAAGLGKTGNWAALGLLAALAVAREGAETVVFLFGMLSGSDLGSAGLVAGSGTLGLGAALLTLVAFRSGASAFSKKAVLTFSQILLLALGSGLLMTALDKAVSLDFISTMTSPLWDTSWLLDDATGPGAFISGLIGYRARPELLPLLALGGYWTTALLAYASPLANKALA
ncbi:MULTISPECIES: FTR1 family iron permease [unclassified Rhizobium]|uniref:FTR1 family iron permease n=1 Tax=unclassified Rhizobium TaxID=2613769 RepID=UPI001ADB587C|nr:MULTISPECIES: FTR1 family protein [unclassified Rhizobium]MBO9126946.1 FTR1 family protein [Rhizobium sp. 16-488-2b]MBO9177394.1 FTR1 family protein [Rhizobium sp. 16-488-2a]